MKPFLKIVILFLFIFYTNITKAQDCFLTVSLTSTSASCGFYNGTITIAVQSGNAPYLYSHDGGISFQANNIFINLGAGMYPITVKDANGCRIDAIAVVNTGTINSWTGAINNEWENSGNWSCGTTPSSNTDVVINSGTIVLNSNVTINTLLIRPEVIFTVNSGFNLTVLH